MKSWRGNGWREPAFVVLASVILTVFLTAPLSFHLGSAARLDNADTRFLIWNVAWVARTLLVDPLHVYDANIFHPHQGTLAYSETNLGAGALAIPAYWATRNPYFAHNFVVLLSFVLNGTATYYLVRYLVTDRRSAAVAATCFAFGPYLFSHLPHVHLLMIAGLPASMLAFHRLADRPTPWAGVVLGAALGAQALFSGYYGTFAGLTVGFSVVVIAATRRLWTDARYWTAIAIAAAVTLAIVIPLFVPYLRLSYETGFSRPMHESRLWSATWRTYLASSAYAHSWMLPIIGRWNEILFPGFMASVAGVAGLALGGRAGGRRRELATLYGGLAVLAVWVSLGPAAGFYRVLQATMPGISFTHAPSRFGLLAGFALCVMTGVSISALLARLDRSQRAGRVTALAVILVAAAALELKTPLSFSRVPPVQPAYRMLATMPRGPVLELPFYSWRFAAARTQYLLDSTAHWMPLVNGYSSHTPRDFLENTNTLAGFPSLEAFRLLERDRVRYAVFHLDRFSPDAREDVVARLRTFDRYLARRYADERIWLYEIVEFPR